MKDMIIATKEKMWTVFNDEGLVNENITTPSLVCPFPRACAVGIKPRKNKTEMDYNKDQPVKTCDEIGCTICKRFDEFKNRLCDVVDDLNDHFGTNVDITWLSPKELKILSMIDSYPDGINADKEKTYYRFKMFEFLFSITDSKKGTFNKRNMSLIKCILDQKKNSNDNIADAFSKYSDNISRIFAGDYNVKIKDEDLRFWIKDAVELIRYFYVNKPAEEAAYFDICLNDYNKVYVETGDKEAANKIRFQNKARVAALVLEDCIKQSPSSCMSVFRRRFSSHKLESYRKLILTYGTNEDKEILEKFDGTVRDNKVKYIHNDDEIISKLKEIIDSGKVLTLLDFYKIAPGRYVGDILRVANNVQAKKVSKALRKLFGDIRGQKSIVLIDEYNSKIIIKGHEITMQEKDEAYTYIRHTLKPDKIYPQLWDEVLHDFVRTRW